MYNTYMIKLFIYFSCVSYLLTHTYPYNFISITPNTHNLSHLVTLHNYGYLLTCNDMPDRYRLKCGVININANEIAYYDSKVQHPDFSSFSKGLDVIVIMETHAASKQDVQKQGYHHCAVVRKRLPWPDLLAGFHITETQYPPTTQNTSKKNSKGNTAGGGLNSWPLPPTCPNSAHSINSTPPSIPPRTSTRDPTTSEPRYSDSIAPTIAWTLNWVDTRKPLANYEPVGSAILEQWDTNIMYSNAPSSWTSKSTTTSM